MQATYKGRTITIWNKMPPEEWGQMLEGESWIMMRRRTQHLRDGLEKENEDIAKEFNDLVAKLEAQNEQ